jgi:hypothetical protein
MLLAGVAVLILSRGSHGEPAGTLPTPLDAITHDAVSTSALEWTIADYRAVSGVPQVALARDLTLADLLSLGACPRRHTDPADPRHALVVVRGDLDLSNWPGIERRHPDPTDRRFRYLAYIVDTGLGTPRLIEQPASRNEGGFRTILAEPNMPGDVAPALPAGTRQVDTTMKLEDCPAMKAYDIPVNPRHAEQTVAPGLQ